jgi:hypothetical protein
MFANIRIPDMTAALLDILQAIFCMFQQPEPTGSGRGGRGVKCPPSECFCLFEQSFLSSESK